MTGATRNFEQRWTPIFGESFLSPKCSNDDRGSRRFLPGTRLCWKNGLFDICGSFRDLDLDHESCIKGANHVRGGVSKSTFVEDNDSVHTQHAFQSHSLDHLFSLITDAHVPQWLKKKIHGTL